MSLYEGQVSELVELLSDYFYFLYEIGCQVIYWESGTGAME